MKKFIAACLLSAMSVSALATDMILPIRSIADGDTIRSSLKLPCPLCNVSVRILGIDTPESTYLAKCEAEKIKGLATKEFLKSYASGYTTMALTNFKWDKYGGRIDAYVAIGGVDIGQLLLDKGMAKPYTGTGPKPDWCI